MKKTLYITRLALGLLIVLGMTPNVMAVLTLTKEQQERKAAAERLKASEKAKAAKAAKAAEDDAKKRAQDAHDMAVAIRAGGS